MKIYDYILQNGKIENYDKLRQNSARCIVVSDMVGEFVVPQNMVTGLFSKSIAKKYIKENLMKNPNNYYFLPTKFSGGLYCTYINKTKLNEAIKIFSTLDFQWVSPFYFAMEIIEENSYRNGKLYINIGDFIYRIEVEDQAVITYHSYLKDSYYSKDMKKVDFFKKSVIWVGED